MNKIDKIKIAEVEALILLLKFKKAEIDKLIEEYNNYVLELNETIDEIHCELEGYYEEKSEKWQKSEKGLDYLSWIEAWDVEVEEISTNEPDIPNSEDFPSEA